MTGNPSLLNLGEGPQGHVKYVTIRGESAGAGWPRDDAVDEGSYLGVLREKTGLAFDLPTEAEWEYACRAGTGTALNSGKNLEGTWREANVAEVGRYCYNSGYSGACDGNGHDRNAATGGSYLPNAWGLFDMHGNWWEWCLDWHGAYGEGAATDPAGPDEGTARVIRGGAWYSDAPQVRSAARRGYPPTGWYAIGFRVACHGDAEEEVQP
jgi:formylglycine-generating enzyme required for sulfatase activity